MPHSSAGELDFLLGLDRIPEVRTLREKIKHLSTTGQVKEWASALSQQWMEADPEAVGTLYVDGHVRVYHGKNKLPKRYVSRQKLCMRGMSDYWLNDQQRRRVRSGRGVTSRQSTFEEAQDRRDLNRTARRDHNRRPSGPWA